jgi:hypothetical protein
LSPFASRDGFLGANGKLLKKIVFVAGEALEIDPDVDYNK